MAKIIEYGSKTEYQKWQSYPDGTYIRGTLDKDIYLTGERLVRIKDGRSWGRGEDCGEFFALPAGYKFTVEV